MITICLTYFKSLALSNLAAALYSVRCQDLSRVKALVIVDNDTGERAQAMRDLIDALEFPLPVQLLVANHGDASKTHSWSTNFAVSQVETPWVCFTRADYILDFGLLGRMLEVIDRKPVDWNGFVTANGYHLNVDVGVVEETAWRSLGTFVLDDLSGSVVDYTTIDAGVWAARREAFLAVGGLDEGLTAWGHAQTHFQWKLHEAGVEFVRIQRVMFYHPQHAAPRDLDLAYRQLCERGIDLRELWARSDGYQPYGRPQ